MLESSTFGFDERRRERETDAVRVGAGTAGYVGIVLRLVVVSTFVAYDECESSPDQVTSECDGAPAVAGGVVEQDVERLGDGGGRGGDVVGWKLPGQNESSPLGGETCVPVGPNLTDDLREVEVLGAGRLADKAEQVGDGSLETVGDGEDFVESGGWIGSGRGELGFYGEAEPGDRCAELVGGVGAEVAFALHGLAEAVCGGGEGVADVVELGYVGGWHVDAEVAVSEAGGG